MRKNLLIDPYMFCLNNDLMIKDNLDFFSKVIQLCSTGKIKIYLYQGLLEKMLNNYHTNPFPIQADKIRNIELKSQVMILNRNIMQVLSAGIVGIEIEECEGEQDMKSMPDLTGDSLYFELLSVMLSKCYNKAFPLEPYVLIGNIKSRMSIGSYISLECVCDTCNFSQKYEWCSPNVFEDKKDLALDSLKVIPEKNSSYIPGTITVDKIGSGSNSEIVEGWLFCQTGFKSNIKMYFPMGVGFALCTYTNNCFSYEKIEKLKTGLGMR